MPMVIPLAVSLTVVLCTVAAASGSPSSTAAQSRTIDNDYHVLNVSESEEYVNKYKDDHGGASEEVKYQIYAFGDSRCDNLH